MSFQDRSAKVLVIDQSGAVRQLMTDVIRAQGFETITGVSSIKDAVGVLEVEPIDWIVAPLMKVKNEINAMQLIRLISERPVLKKTRVSLLLEQAEFSVLNKAFELGLLSWFEKPFNKDTLQKAIADFLETFEKCEWNDTRLSSSYLREHLKNQKSWKNIISLEKNLLNVFPGDLDLLLNIATPQYHLEQTEQAQCTLRQVLAIDQDMSEKAINVAKELFGDDNYEDIMKKVSGEESDINALGIESCVIIDPDDASRKLVVDSLKNLGVKEVHEFENGEGAWQWMGLQKEVDLIIQEWRIPKVTGPIFVQRCRKQFPCTPVITISSLITEEDKPLVLEMGIAAVVEKPIKKKEMIETITRVVQEDRLPTQAAVLEDKIRKLLEAGEYEEAVKMKANYFETKDLPEPRKKMIEAEFAYADGKYTQARDLAVEVIKSKSDSITVLNFIGKCLMKLKDFVAALKCFKKAQNLSPKNIQRLCAIAEASNEIGDEEGSKEAVEQAESMDEGSDQVKETKAGIAVTEGNTDEAMRIMSGLSNLSDVISYLNNKAVASAKSGLLDEALSIYNKTLDSIPEDRKNYKAIVCYNLALNYAKMDKLDESLEYLEKGLKCGETKVTLKSKVLMKKIKNAKESGKELVFNFDTASGKSKDSDGAAKQDKPDGEASKPIEIQSDHAVILAAVEVNPGEFCCFKVFLDQESPDEEAETLIKDAIRFSPREAVAREEAAGLEKMLKKGA